jgi:hypothetical protein
LMRVLEDAGLGGAESVWASESFLGRAADAIAEAEVRRRLGQRVEPVLAEYGSGAAGGAGEECAVTVSGEDYRAALYGKLDEIDALEFPRSHHQKNFHECFTRACLRTIYGDSFEQHKASLLAEYDVVDFKTEVMIVTPRRFGKTFAVAQYCAAFSASVLGREVAIFSTGRRASKKMLDLVLRFLRPVLRPTQKIISSNVEEVIIFDSRTQLRNKICSYPSKVQVTCANTPVCEAAVVAC